MDTTEKMKKVQLELLHELDRVSKLSGFHYYLAYGSCLGAVRHKGFIPWDDDVDVFITVDEMEKLQNSRSLFGDKYFLQNRITDPNYTNIKWAVRDSSTSYFGDSEDNRDINHGIDMDIYVLFPYPDNFFSAHKLILESYLLRFLYMDQPPRNHGKIGKIGYSIAKALFKGERKKRKINAIENRLKNNGGKRFYSVFMGNDITPFSCIKFPQSCFKEPKMLKFEDFMAPCPTEPETICEITYGKTYMEFPPEDQRHPQHHALLLDFDTPYEAYRGKYFK